MKPPSYKNESLPSIVDLIYINLDRHDIDAKSRISGERLRKEKTMKILVTGATGTVGSEVVKALLQRGADVRALTRKQHRPGTFPGAVEIALGDLSDPVSVAEAIKGVDKLFLLIGNVADEFTQALPLMAWRRRPD